MLHLMVHKQLLPWLLMPFFLFSETAQAKRFVQDDSKMDFADTLNPDKALCAVKAAHTGRIRQTAEYCVKSLGEVCSCECQCWKTGTAECEGYETSDQFKCTRERKKECAAEWQKEDRYIFDSKVVDEDFATAMDLVVLNNRRMFRVNVMSLLFSQMQGSYHYQAKNKNHYTIATTLCSLVKGELDPNSLPPLNVLAFRSGSKKEPRLMSLSNRRLIALQLFAQYYPERVTELYNTEGLYVKVNLASNKTFDAEKSNIHPMCNNCGSCVPGREFRHVHVLTKGVRFPVYMLFGTPGTPDNKGKDPKLKAYFDKLMDGKNCSDVKTQLDTHGKKDLEKLLKQRRKDAGVSS